MGRPRPGNRREGDGNPYPAWLRPDRGDQRIAAGDEGILVTTPEASGRLKEALDLGGADSFAMRDTGTARTRRIELESGRTLTISQDSAPLVVLVCEEGEGELHSDGATFQLAPGASVAIGRPARITIAARQRLRVLHIACESFP